MDRHHPTPRRPLRGLALGLAAACLAASACVGSGVGGQEIKSDQPPAPAQEDLLPGIVEATNGFALDLLRTEPDGNLVLAPLPVAQALAMTRVGADGETRAQLDQALHAGEVADYDAGFNTLLQVLRAREGERRSERRKGRVEVYLPASLWGQRGTRFQPAWLATLAEDYGTGVWVTDFSSDPESSRRAINDWVDRETNGAIGELVRRGEVSQYTRLTAASAGFVDAPWLQEFDRERTRPASFRHADGTTSDVPTMGVAAADVGVATGDGWEAVELPYLGGEIGLLVVVPRGQSLSELEAGLTPDALDGIAGDLRPRNVDLRAPAFGFTTSLDLDDDLRRLGVTAVFSEQDAQLGGITGDDTLALSSVAHQAFFGIDEEGTGGGAAATVQPTELDVVPATRSVVVDQPFLFAVRDRATGAVLLLGRVTRPG